MYCCFESPAPHDMLYICMYVIYVCVCVLENHLQISFVGCNLLILIFSQLLAELDMLSRGFMLWRTNHGRVDVLNIAFVLNYHVI